MLEFVEAPGRPDDWDDLIQGYDTKTLFHESAWLDHVQTIHPRAKIEYYRIMDGDGTVGYFCDIRVRKMLLPIAGSPLGGTGTNFMGPVVNHDIDQGELLQAIIRLCRRKRVAHLEINNPWFDPETMRSHGFDVHESVTHLIELPDTVDAAWGMLKSACRNRVRKAQKNGTQVEFTDDPSIADRYQEQFEEVYAKQGMMLPYDVERPRSLVRHLAPAKRMLSVWVKHEGEVISTGLFPFDDRCIYFWGGASWLRYQHLCPNELLQWTLIEEAVKRGIPRYNMCGGHNQFKNKFGGEDVPFVRYSRSALPALSAARKMYLRFHFWKLKALASRKARKLSTDRGESERQRTGPSLAGTR